MPGASGFSAAADQIRTGSQKFNDVTGGLQQTAQTLSSVLDSQGECWGGDETGQAFAKDYVPQAQTAVQAFTTMVSNIQALQQNLDQAAASYEGTDADAAQNIAEKA
jgi:WXG100 family type VII secretion target